MTIKTAKPDGRARNRGLKDYAGVRFDRLIAIEFVSRDNKDNNHQWRFVCDCGNTVVLRIKSVRSGHTGSCGCKAAELLSARNTTHGLSGAHRSEYRSWKDMRSRCNNPGDSDYQDYGGRGITVCEEWSSFGRFFADMGEKPARMTIDRQDVNGNYEPGNCRWATAKEQANNKRSNVYISIGGVEKTLQEWSDAYGVRRETARWRMKQGWPIESVFTKTDYRSGHIED
jgi:hypothetical protein